MATYFHGAPDIQSDGLQTLYLMNPGYAGYSEASNPSNMVFLNSSSAAAAANSLNQVNLSNTPHPSHHQQHLVGIPLQAAALSAQDPPSIHSPLDISAVHGLIPRLHYNNNLWTPTPANNPIDMTSQLGFRRLAVTPHAQQGLSLSLSPQQPTYASYRTDHEIQAAPAISPAGGDEMRISCSSSCIPSLQSILTGSKYLEVAQQLLDEVVNVGKGANDESSKVSYKTQTAMNREKEDTSGDQESTARRGAELTTAERQELQMKKAKLINMLDEVEQRYKQYHHQMQIVVSSFEAAARFGSARTYTALALQTISKQFRCLRDTISGQIQATSKSLGEEDGVAGGGIKNEGSRLRFVDHQLRQQRALQQLGMIQHNAWRPQRGLPERSVSVLRAWLFEHFLHPYPKDSDKLMLAKQTGLTRSQVSNWFINARVRLWKPMVEEMYLEETKEKGQQSNNVDCKSKSDPDEGSVSKSSSPQESSPTRTTEQTDDTKRPTTRLIPSSSSASSKNVQVQASDGDGDGHLNMQPNNYLKKARTEESLHPNIMQHSMNMMMDLKHDDTTNGRDLFMKFGDGRQGMSGDQGYSFVAGASNNGGSFGAYTIGELGRFDPEQFAPRFSGNNGVSLTLGLPHCESLALSGTPQSYFSSESIPLGRRLDMSSEAIEYCSLNNNNNSSNGYEEINIQNNKKRFAAQLMPDFVA